MKPPAGSMRRMPTGIRRVGGRWMPPYRAIGGPDGREVPPARPGSRLHRGRIMPPPAGDGDVEAPLCATSVR